MATSVVVNGYLAMASQAMNVYASRPRYVAQGTGAGTSAITDTTLFTESSEARVLGTTSVVTTTKTNDTFRVVGAITADGTKGITNAGTFDAATAGNLGVKGDFDVVNVNADDIITYTIDAIAGNE